MKYFTLVLLLLSGMAMAIEEPEYTVESVVEHYEIRRYGAVLVAETIVASDFSDAGNQAFRILASYIFGANQSKAKIAMTAPVNQLKSSIGYLVQFTMPKKYTLDTLPNSNDTRVHLRQVPARRVAVFTYSGSWSESRYKQKLESFREELQKNKLETIGEPVLARYNSPFQIWFLRRNEIWLELK